jgi:Ca-activated chloride channel family protein
MTTRLTPTLPLLVLGSLACGGGQDSYVPSRVGGHPRSEVMEGDVLAEDMALSDEVRPSGQSLAQTQLAAPPGLAPAPDEAWNTERYDYIAESGFLRSVEQPLSTFSVDVDTAAYSNVRRFLAHGQRPPPDAVRIEELLNYFRYAYEAPRGEHPIAITTELCASPFSPGRSLLRVGLAAADPAASTRPARNLVFLIDVSGSMDHPSKLPLVQRALGLLVDQLQERDRIAIVVYAGDSGVLLEPTSGEDKDVIREAIDSLTAGGSTNGAGGIELAYDLAQDNYQAGAVNRVILATDGDFNVGVTDRGSLLRLIERRREQGIQLTVLGFGMGNLKDATMEMLADHGNGNYAYIDTLREARKVLVEEVEASLRTVAQDAKVQLEWNPRQVARYRLIGYENRRLADQDFNDDRKDAGDLGDGHRVTVLYELELAPAAASDELVTIKVRYKRPGAAASQLLSETVAARARTFESATDDLRFAAAVAGFGMLLRGSAHRGELDWGGVAGIARGALGRDDFGYRREFLELVARARDLHAR